MATTVPVPGHLAPLTKEEVQEHLNRQAQQQMMQIQRDPLGAAMGLAGVYAPNEAKQANPQPRRVRAELTEVNNGWLVEYENDQHVFADETSLAEWLTGRRVQNRLEGK